MNSHSAGNATLPGAIEIVGRKKAVPKEVLDSLLADNLKPEDLIGENGLLERLGMMSPAPPWLLDSIESVHHHF